MGSDRREPGDLIVRGITAIATCILLVFLLVFFTNRGAFQKNASRDATENNPGVQVTVETEGKETEYGIQIGDNLKAFITDDSFFDDYAAIPVTESYTEEEVVSVSILAAYEDSRLVIRLFDNTGKMITGARFEATLQKRGADNAEPVVFSDDDTDGVIYATGLDAGEWDIVIGELDGYHVPTDPATITIKEDA